MTPSPQVSADDNTAACKRIRHHGYHRAFTLVELLAVISIIAVLAAILVSVTQKTRETANAAKCVVKLRALGNAVNLYRTDKLGYPKAVDFSSGNYWFTDIAPYLQTVFAAVDDKKETPYRCPSVKARTWPFIDYAVNGYMLPAETAKDDVPFMKIDRPSTTFLLADSVAWISAPPTWFGEGRLDKQFEFRHANAANVVMFDGHVEKVTKQQLTDPKAEKRMKGLPE